jgi:hypothetical protein
MNMRWLYYQVHGRKPARATTPRRQHSGPARSWKYKAWIRTLGCCCCGRVEGIEAAHTGKDGGAAIKASDYSCIPACSDCHQFAPDSYHRDRRRFEQRVFDRLGMTIPELVKMLNQEWKSGKEEAA